MADEMPEIFTKFRTISVLIVLFLIAGWFYFPSIANYFVADSIVGAQLGWKDILTEMTGRSFVLGYRPMAVAWFVLNNKLWGDAALGHHVVATLVHACNGLLLYLIVKRVQKDEFTAIIAALFFIAAPVHVEAIQWLAAAAGSVVASFWFLLATWIWIKEPTIPDLKTKFLSAFFYLMALFTKEIAFALPFILLLIDKRLNRFSKSDNFKKYLLSLSAYWPFVISLLIYFLGYYFSGAWQNSLSKSQHMLPDFNIILLLLNKYSDSLFSPVSGFIEWRVGYLNWIWLIGLILLIYASKLSRWAFLTTLICLLPGIFYFSERIAYLPMAFFSAGFAIILVTFFNFAKKQFNKNFIRQFIRFSLFGIILLILVLDFRFVRRKLVPWNEASRLCITIPEKIYEILPNPVSGSQIIMVDMTIITAAGPDLWALCKGVEKYYKGRDVEIKQVYLGQDVGNLVNIASIECQSEKVRYFVKYNPSTNKVELVDKHEAGLNCPPKLNP